MRIVLIIQKAPLYLPQFLDDFLQKISNTDYVIHDIVTLPPIFFKGKRSELAARYNFYGLNNFLRAIAKIIKHEVFSVLYYIIPSIGCHSVANVLHKYKINQNKAASVNSRGFIEYIKTNRIDLIISIAAPVKFKKGLLNAPLKKCINYHSSILPRNRGRQPLFWALFNDEPEVGVSIHEMDEKIDNGPIIVQGRFSVEPEDTLDSLYKKTIEAGPDLLLEAIQKIDTDDPGRIVNDPSRATYNKFPTKSDSRLFKEKGKRYF